MEDDIQYDPTGLPSVNEIADQFAEEQEKQDALNNSVQQANLQREKYTAEREDPRNRDSWGLAAVGKEIGSAISGGVVDTVSSGTTFAERTIDAFSGAMQREIEEQGYYRPDWDPFYDYEDPIVTKTWWGQLLRGTVHFGTMALGTVIASK